MGERMTEPYGPEALAAWLKAMSLVKAHDYEGARKVNLYSSDRIALEKMISKEEAKVRGEQP